MATRRVRSGLRAPNAAPPELQTPGPSGGAGEDKKKANDEADFEVDDGEESVESGTSGDKTFGNSERLAECGEPDGLKTESERSSRRRAGVQVEGQDQHAGDRRSHKPTAVPSRNRVIPGYRDSHRGL